MKDQTIKNQRVMKENSQVRIIQKLRKNNQMKCQELDLQTQLSTGVRFFDMELKTGIIDKTILYVKIGNIFKYVKFTDVLNTFKVFLNEQKLEILLLRLTPDTNAVHLVKKLLSEDTYVWMEPNIPSVSQVRGKIVLLQSSTFHLGIASGVTFTFHNGKPKEEQLPENLSQAGKYCASHLVITDTSTTNIFDVPEKVAEKFNKVIGKHLEELLHDSNGPSCLGVIAMDFPNQEIIKKIIAFNLRGAAKSSSKMHKERHEARNSD
ncbi:uncharacterized protein LOC134073185 [Sardina pilchardus]|uniref:uncharacterized protein LOC134073185 n=1 Tax=Sardina pilchardus TaxID=27697 RepID=UPI002E167A51